MVSYLSLQRKQFYCESITLDYLYSKVTEDLCNRKKLAKITGEKQRPPFLKAELFMICDDFVNKSFLHTKNLIEKLLFVHLKKD